MVNKSPWGSGCGTPSKWPFHGLYMGVTSYLLTGIWAIYYKSLICIKAILGRIPLLNYFLGWPTGGLVALNCLVGWSSKYECHPHIFCRSLQFTLPPCRVCGPSRTVLAVVHRGPSCHALYLEKRQSSWSRRSWNLDLCKMLGKSSKIFSQRVVWWWFLRGSKEIV